MLRLLVVDGNTPAGRQPYCRICGRDAGGELRRRAAHDRPRGDRRASARRQTTTGQLRPTAGILGGVAITGSSLNIYQRDIASLRQIDFVREVFARGIPMFGSCWGLQLATVAAGGEVGLNPRGREVAFARKIALTSAGCDHRMHATRDAVFDRRPFIAI